MKYFSHILLYTALQIAVLVSCTVYVQSQPSYATLKIVNNSTSGTSTSNIKSVYLIFLAKTLDSPAVNSVIQFDNNLQGTLVPITSNSQSNTYSYRLDSLLGYTPTGGITIQIPPLQSGRCYISFNYPLQMPTITAKDGTISFQAPSTSNVSDPNYTAVFDKFEFSYTKDNKLYINPTAVDFFSVPLTFQGYPDSSTTMVTYGSPLGSNRDALMKPIQDSLKRADSTNMWQPLIIPTNDPNKSTLRINAPFKGPPNTWDTTYLGSATTLGSYIKALVDYYKTNTLVISCNELNDSTEEILQLCPHAPSPAQDSGLYTFRGTINTSNQWQFQNSPTISTVKLCANANITRTIDMNSVTTQDFFQPGTDAFATPNKTIQSILVKYITAAFTVGLLPAPNNQLLDSKYLNTNQFQPNKYLKNLPGGPWYNLYSKTIHSVISKIYTFPYDDVLGQDGTLVVTTSATTTITIGNMGTIQIPPQKQSFSAVQVTSCSITYNQDSTMVTISASWTPPSGQSPNAGYLIAVPGVSLPNKADAIFIGTSGSITFPTANLPTNTPNSCSVIVYTCSSLQDLGCQSCDSVIKYNLGPTNPGSVPCTISPCISVSQPSIKPNIQKKNKEGLQKKSGKTRATSTNMIWRKRRLDDKQFMVYDRNRLIVSRAIKLARIKA